MSHTPRTDKIREQILSPLWKDSQNKLLLTIQHGEQLERELAQAQQQIAGLQEDKESIVFYKKSLGRIADLFGITQLMMIGASDKNHPEETYVDILIRLIKSELDTINARKEGK